MKTFELKIFAKRNAKRHDKCLYFDTLQEAEKHALNVKYYILTEFDTNIKLPDILFWNVGNYRYKSF